jgi:hypothetical protein
MARHDHEIVIRASIRSDVTSLSPFTTNSVRGIHCDYLSILRYKQSYLISSPPKQHGWKPRLQSARGPLSALEAFT